MKCNYIDEHILDLATGSAANAEVASHLKACDACATRLDEFRSTMSLLDEWTAPEPSPYFDTRLQARLREEAAKQPSGLLAWLRRPILAGAMAALMLAGVIAIRVTDHNKPVMTAQTPSAVTDLQALDSDEDVFAHFDILDDGVQNETQPSSANY